MSTSYIQQVRESLRLQQVYNVFFRYGWDMALDRWPTANSFRQMMQKWIWEIPDDVDLGDVTTPAKIRMMFEELGPTYVKVGQIISSQSSSLPAEWNVELAKLQSSVPAFPSDQVRQVIQRELKAPPEEIYASFSPEPFAAASTAQVHRATLKDGTEVVVKVQRPGIQKQMRADIGIMRNATRVLAGRVEAVRAVDLPGMVDQFGTGALRELDYTGEAYNAYVLGANLSTIEGVRVPKVYYDLSTTRVLTLELIKGVKISNVEAIEAAGLDRKELARNALRAMIKMLLIDGFFHADPHPGNILVNLDTGMITLLDTGMVGELDLQKRLTLIWLIMALKNSDVASMGRLLRNLSTPFIDKVDENGFQRDFERMVNRLMLVSNQNLTFGAVVNDSMDLLRTYGLRLDPDLTMALKALMQAEAVASALSLDAGIASEGTDIIRELAQQELTAEKVVSIAKKQFSNVAAEAFKQLPSLQDATLSWLNQYRKGRFEVVVDTSSLGVEMAKLGRIGRLLVIGIVLAGMIVGSAIATLFLEQSTEQGDAWYFIGRLAYLGYIFAMALAIIIVLRLMWGWWRGSNDI